MAGENGSGQAQEVTPVFMPPLPGMPLPPIPGFWVSDNANASSAPTEINATSGDAGLNTEWDADSLDGAISWLEHHAKYLGDRLAPAMSDDIGSEEERSTWLQEDEDVWGGGDTARAVLR